MNNNNFQQWMQRMITKISRTNVWILYARIFYAQHSASIAWILYGGSLFGAVMALLYSSIADYLGYDKMMVILLTLKFIGVFLECIGIDISILVLGYLLTTLAVIFVCYAYIAWILPHKYSIAYTALFYSLYTLSYLSGAMIGSVLSYLIPIHVKHLNHHHIQH